MLLIPAQSPISADPYRPLADMLAGVLVTPSELAEHWKYSENHLANLRRIGKGLPHVKLPGGAIRYRVSEIAAAEIAGTDGPVTLERVLLALAAAPISETDRAATIAHIRQSFGR